MHETILQQYITIVDFLGNALGPDYEIVLHDLSQKNNAVIAISNGHISKRKIGSPLTNAALQMLASKAYENSNFLYNYTGMTEDGHVLRSSTMFIKNRTGKPVGLLCINFDDRRYEELHDKLFSILHPNAFLKVKADKKDKADLTVSVPSPTEKFSTDITLLMNRIYDDVTTLIQIPADHLNQEDKIKIISNLNEQGMFQLKGSVPFTAKRLACSTASVYRYLSDLARQ